jgi:hypothetical protein
MVDNECEWGIEKDGQYKRVGNFPLANAKLRETNSKVNT